MIPIAVRCRLEGQILNTIVIVVLFDRNIFVTISLFGDKLTPENQTIILTKINTPLQ